MHTLGHRLRELRKSADRSQGQVAIFAGISQSTVSDLENGKINPKTVDAIIALARYYGTTTDYLLGLTDDPSPYPRTKLPEHGPEVLAMLRGLSPARMEEIVKIVRVLYESEQRSQARDRMLAMALSLDNVGMLDTLRTRLIQLAGELGSESEAITVVMSELPTLLGVAPEQFADNRRQES